MQESFKRIIIASPNPTFAEKLKKHFERNGCKVVDIIVVLEHLVEKLELLEDEGEFIDGIILQTDIARKNDDKRLELLSDTLLMIREKYSNISFVVLANEKSGHPLLAELVSMGIYNIIVKENGANLNIPAMVNMLSTPTPFSEVAKFRVVDKSIPWRRDLDSHTAITVNKRNPEIIEKEVVKEKIIEKIVEKETVVEIPKLITVEPKMIAIGSLYPRTGSSFIAGNLAYYLSKHNIPTALVESPTNKPYWYEYFEEDNNKPEHWISWANQIVSEGKVKKGTDWLLKNGIHLVAHDRQIKSTEWNDEKNLKYLFTAKQVPIVIYDCSHSWEDESVKTVLDYADEIWVVVDYDLVHLNQNIPLLIQLKETYQERFKLIVNKEKQAIKVTKKFNNELIQEEPITKLPYVEDTLTCQWQFKLFLEQEGNKDLIEPQIKELALRIVNKDIFGNKQSGFLKRLFNLPPKKVSHF